jgi:hypothetical protein
MAFITKKESKVLAREREGVWVKYMEGELLIARMGNPHNRRTFQRIRAPFKRQIQRGSLKDTQQAAIVAETYAESILLDWRGQLDEEGKEFPYTRENAILVLENDLDLRDFVEQIAQESALFRETEVEEKGKKSPKKSGG